jgi:hypothetical protein
MSHQQSQTAAPKSPLTRQEMLDLVDRHITTELAGDLEGMLATVTPEPRFTGYPDGDEVVGKAEFRARYSVLLPRFKEMVKAEQKRVWADEERQDVVVEFDGRVNLPGGEVIPIRTLAIFEFEDGLISHEIAFSSQLLTAFGPAEE